MTGAAGVALPLCRAEPLGRVLRENAVVAGHPSERLSGFTLLRSLV